MMNHKFLFSLLFMCACIILLIILLGNNFERNDKNIYLLRYHRTDMTSNTKLLNIKNITYLINPVCKATFLVWIVTSFAGNPSTRSALRRAYSNKELLELGIQRVFLLGTMTDNIQHDTHTSQSAILDESQRFNDIVQGTFIEDYRNLVFKHLMGLTWVTNNCRHAQYVMKMDDDIILNLYDIVIMLNEGQIPKNAMTGYTLKGMIPIREPANKWFVTKQEFSANIYPDFLSGWLYFTSLDIAKQLIDVTRLYKEYFWIDDVFVTGILRNKLNIKIQQINNLYATDYRYINCCMDGKKKNLKCDIVIAPNGGDTELQVKFKHFAEYCNVSCSRRTKLNSVINTCITEYTLPNLGKGKAQINSVKIL